MRILSSILCSSVLLIGILQSHTTQPASRIYASQSQVIPLIENESGPLYGTPLFDLELDLSLGIDEGEPAWQIFGRQIAFDVSPDGSMHIFSIPNTEGIYVVSHEGELQGTMLPPGSGPGESNSPGRSWWIDDGSELWIYDRRLHRISILTPEGSLQETIPLTHLVGEWRSLVQLENRKFIGIRPARDSEGRQNSITEYGFLSDDFKWDKTLVRLPLSSIRPRTFISGNVEIGLPFSAINFFVIFPSGRIAWGDTDEGIITFHNASGFPQLRCRCNWMIEKVTAEDRANWLNRIEERSPRDLPAARRAHLPDRWGAFYWPETDDRDRIWVPKGKPVFEGGERVGWTYEVFNSSGIWLGSQFLPVPHQELVIQDGFLYMAINSDDHGPVLKRYILRSRFDGLEP